MYFFLLFAFVVLAAAGGFVAGWLNSRSRLGAQARAERAEAETAAALLIEKTGEQIRDGDARIEAMRADIAEAQRTIARMEGEATRLPELREEILGLKSERDELHQQLQGALGQLAQAAANLDNERRQNAEKLALLNGARDDLKNEFKVLAADILKDNSATFTAANQANIGNLLEPLKTRLIDFQAKVQEVQKEGIEGRTELKTHIGELRSLHQQLSSDTKSFVNVLKGSSRAQGDWGEFVLEGLLDACGLRKGHEYRVQESFATADGTNGRPDVIVNLSGGHHLVIDAKVSLVSYSDYCNCEDETKRDALLSRHLSSVRTHLNAFSLRKYQALHGLNSLDFVVMFVPIEPAYMLAIARDEKLWEDAWRKDVLLVSPATLLFVLRTVANLSRQETQSRKVQEIVDKGRDLYDKLAAFAKDLTDVGSKLNSARDSYDEAVKKLSTGRGSAIRQAELLKELGVKPTKSLPIAMVDASLDDLEEPLRLSSIAAVDADYMPDSLDEVLPLNGVVRSGSPEEGLQPSIFGPH